MFGLGDINGFLDNLIATNKLSVYKPDDGSDYIESMIKYRIDQTRELESMYNDINPDGDFDSLSDIQKIQFKNMLSGLIMRMVENRRNYLDIQIEKESYS